MAEKPILFKPEMVRAILEGRKTQTRRIVAPRQLFEFDTAINVGECSNFIEDGKRKGDDEYLSCLCPLGRGGDELWVKEAHYLWGYWVTDGKTKSGMTKRRFVCDRSYPVLYSPPEKLCNDRSKDIGYWKRNSLFMPRWASRIQLRITDVRVERVQDISEGDAGREGITQGMCWGEGCSAVDWFKALWNSINGADENKQWKSNPYVWVIEFERIIK